LDEQIKAVMEVLGDFFSKKSYLYDSFRTLQETAKEEEKQLELAERGQGKSSAVREAEVTKPFAKLNDNTFRTESFFSKCLYRSRFLGC
jgi:hypothetical protein